MLNVSGSADAANWQNVQGKILSPDELDENPPYDVQERRSAGQPAVSRGRLRRSAWMYRSDEST